ncbi:AraC family transcriptional regulator [Dongia sp.]|uniref:AraC family transcriptional regulator n=1 Tax=Dongia sp. TaxID=1977262 RepID=UPI0035B0BB5F
MDPLSDLLALLRPRNYMSAGFDAGPSWSVHFPDQTGTIKTGAIITGGCWLAVEGVAAPVQLAAGDCFLLPRGLPFTLASDLALTPTPARNLLPAPSHGRIHTLDGGGQSLMVSSRFALDGPQAEMLLNLLPPIVHIRKENGEAALRGAIERTMQELRDPQPGSTLVMQHLAHMMLIEALRLHLAQGAADTGWLAGLAHRQIGAALRAMHDDPAQRWTLETLAGRAAMSRSTFALKFKETVGMPAMDYLTRWRMLLAGDRLMHTAESVASIALSLGYESEAAFATAFKREMGVSPRAYGRQGRAAAQ